MKILLLEHPRIGSDEHYNDVANAPLSACLSIGYVAAQLAGQGHSVDVCDAYGQDASFDQCCEQLLQRDCDLLGVHGVYFWENTPQLFYMLQKYKSYKPETKLVLFGIFPTFAFKEILSLYPCVDAIIIGEPEMTFCELAAAYELGTGPVDAVAGIAFLDRSGVKKADFREPVGHLDMLPFPLRHDESLSLVGGSILGSRGCHGRCSFCCINPFYGTSTGRRCRTPENIRLEIEEMLPELKKKYIYFLDADFLGYGPDSKSRVLAIAERLQHLRVQFGFECRAGSFDKAIIGTLAHAGLKDVFLGIESASEAMLNRMQKGLAPSKSAESVQILRSLGIEPNLGFIMFEPDCLLADVRQSLAFLKENSLLRKLDVTANVLYHREIAFRGMPNFDRLAAAGRLTGTDTFGYEGQYRFVDPSAQFLADLMAYVCRRVLRATENARSPICWKRGDSAPSLRVNDYVVNLFAETLRRLELKDIHLDLDGLLRIEDDALCAIEGLIVEERVCQS
jgi:anaerobic magnesium-protoporphyrin IX monomethyl ester cyclase